MRTTSLGIFLTFLLFGAIAEAKDISVNVSWVHQERIVTVEIESLMWPNEDLLQEAVAIATFACDPRRASSDRYILSPAKFEKAIPAILELLRDALTARAKWVGLCRELIDDATSPLLPKVKG